MILVVSKFHMLNSFFITLLSDFHPILLYHTSHYSSSLNIHSSFIKALKTTLLPLTNAVIIRFWPGEALP